MGLFKDRNNYRILFNKIGFNLKETNLLYFFFYSFPNLLSHQILPPIMSLQKDQMIKRFGTMFYHALPNFSQASVIFLQLHLCKFKYNCKLLHLSKLGKKYLVLKWRPFSPRYPYLYFLFKALLRLGQLLDTLMVYNSKILNLKFKYQFINIILWKSHSRRLISEQRFHRQRNQLGVSLV